MTATAEQAATWAEENSALLAAEVGRVRARLLAACGRGGADDVSAADAAAAAKAMPSDWPPPPLDVLRRVFALTDFERDLLLLAAAYELDPGVGDLCADAGDLRRPYPTFALALSILPDPHWSALSSGAPLRTWRLLNPVGTPLTAAQLQLDERILHGLLGIDQLDHRLEPYVVSVTTHHALPPAHQAAAAELFDFWERAAVGAALRLVGRDESDRHGVAADAAGRARRPLYVVRAADLPHRIEEREEFVRLWQREQALSARALMVEIEDEGDEQLVGWLVPRLGGPVVVSARERGGRGRATHVVEVAVPSPAERATLWSHHLDGRGSTDDLQRVAAQFELPAAAIEALGAQLMLSGGDPWTAARDRARPGLDGLAQRIDVRAGWDDLVLPEPQLETLHDIVVHVRQRSVIEETWGFGEKSTRGHGIAALFAGPSGTGKSLAAEVLARALDLDLYVVDLSSVVSKYIGETEKNLRQVFDAAESGGAVLLFDEADAIFGKRSEVRDSHDRYANIEVSYLLQRMERYRGVAILTTNQRSALDDAFLRRLRFVVTFPFPDLAQREAIWARAFPAGVPRDDLRLGELARLSITGGHIANIALSAAFSAADRADRVGAADLLRAAQQEYAKLERPLTDAEAGGLR